MNFTRCAACGRPCAPAGADRRPRRPRHRKVLRVAFNAAETGFDPAKISDIYSRTVTPHIFEALYRPTTTWRGRQDQAADGRGHARDLGRLPRRGRSSVQPGHPLRRRPGVQGRASANWWPPTTSTPLKRLIDPANKSPLWARSIQDLGIVGLNELRARRWPKRSAFDYDREVAGLRALDRYTLKITLKERPRPRLLQILASQRPAGGQAREVVEHYGDDIMAHPVGTGPFRLVQWRRSSLIVLERNPDYRDACTTPNPRPTTPRARRSWRA
jgi:hypothetical protein